MKSIILLSQLFFFFYVQQLLLLYIKPLTMKLYQVIFFLLIILSGGISNAYSQQFVEISKKDFKSKDAGFKKAWLDIQTGNQYFREGPGTYKEALNAYQDAHDYNPYHAGLNYMIGVCYLYTDNRTKALPYLKAAYEFKAEIAPDLRLMLAKAYHYNYEFDKAMDEYQAYIDGLSKKEKKVVDIGSIKNAIDQCHNGKELMKDTVNVEIINMGDKINSDADDYYSVFSPSGNRIYFTSRRQFWPDEKRNLLDNKFNEDIYVSFLENNSVWANAQNVGKPVNTKFNDAALLMSSDGETLYLYRGQKNKGEILYTDVKDGEWSKPKSAPAQIRSGSHESSMSATENGKKIYFVSDRKNDNLGGLDIYMTQKAENGKWTEPVNLGPVINSAFDEEGVYISPDGNKLYFSSKGHNSMGGFDVFASNYENGKWTEPVNMGYPINSTDDDLFFVMQDSITAYISSIRNDGKGFMDIYKILFIPDVEDTVQIVEEKPVPIFIAPFKPDPTFVLNGTVMDEEDSTAIVARIEIIDMDENKIIATTISNDETGEYYIKLKKKTSYGVEVSASGYMFFLNVLTVPDDTTLTGFQRDFLLKKIKVGEKIVLRNIFFEFNKSTLSPESSIELDRVAGFLDSNPSLRIEISGHTDNIGSAVFNQSLSENRAKSVMDYLIFKGIHQSRLEYQGYGYTQPVSSNETEEGRALNRRVEFKIIE